MVSVLGCVTTVSSFASASRVMNRASEVLVLASEARGQHVEIAAQFEVR